jgi:hypothetical protein
MGTCNLPQGWSFLAAAPAYSAFAGILGGFLFAGVIALMAEREHQDNAEKASKTQQHQDDHRSASRQHALMLFLPALLSLIIASFLFGEISGEQVCARGYVEGTFAASLLGIGSIGIFSGIGWMLDVYTTANKELHLTSNVFTFISFFVVVVFLSTSGEDIIENAFNNNAPWYAIWPITAYGPILLVLVSATRLWFMPKKQNRARARLTAVFSPACYVIVVSVVYAILTSYPPKDWPTSTLNDWKAYLALSVSLLLPGINLVIYARAVPGANTWPTIRRLLMTYGRNRLPGSPNRNEASGPSS